MTFRPFFLTLFVAPALLIAATDDTTAIRAVLDKQVADWNRADIPAFVQSYAENCTFIGKTVVEGRAGVEERYRRSYSDAAAMGHLEFSDLKVTKLASRIALVTGAFHLARSAAAGGDTHGLFSLILKRESGAWRIILDHTST